MYQTLTARLIRIEETALSTQSDVDQITADLTRIAGEIVAEFAELDRQIIAAGVSIDTTALRDAVTALDSIAPPIETPTDAPVEAPGPEPV